MDLYPFQKYYKSGHELPADNDNINAETLSIRNRKAGAFSAEKHPKLLRHSSPGLSWERGGSFR